MAAEKERRGWSSIQYLSIYSIFNSLPNILFLWRFEMKKKMLPVFLLITLLLVAVPASVLADAPSALGGLGLEEY